MGLFGKIGSGFSAVSGAVSSATKRSVALADPRRVLRTVDPRSLRKAATSGRLPGASMLPGAAGLAQGVGLSLRDRFRLANGDPSTVAKAILASAESSQSSRWSPKGFARGMGPMVSNIVSVKRASLARTQSFSTIRLARWF